MSWFTPFFFFFFFLVTPSHGDRWRCEWVEEAAGRSWLEPDPVLVPKLVHALQAQITDATMQAPLLHATPLSSKGARCHAGASALIYGKNKQCRSHSPGWKR